MTKNNIVIYTDGACSGNPGKGGWAAILLYKDSRKEISGNNPQTTNNRMELEAVLQALLSLKKSSSVDLYTDSKYVQDGMNKWIANWIKNNWRTSDNKDVKNVDLWKEIYSLSQIHKINFHWVKAHDNNELNNQVDILARNAIKR